MAYVNATNSYQPTANTAGTTAAAAALPVKTLSQQDFLKLLVAQLSAQDPMNPQSNADFAAQMAQFSALQASQGTESEISQLHQDQMVLQANTLIGRAVTLQSSAGAIVSGNVSAVQISNGVPGLLVNGNSYTLDQVLSIQPALN